MPFAPEPPSADSVAPRGTQEWRRAVAAHQRWVANELWSAQAQQGLNLPDTSPTGDVSDFLASLGITNEVGGGRHAWNMFLGNLPSEGFGESPVPGRDGMAYALEAFMPDWKFNLDRAIQSGMPRAEANAMFMPAGFTDPGSASYSQPAPLAASSAAPAAAPAPPSFAAPGPSFPGIGSSEAGGLAASPLGYSEDDALKRARMALQRRRPGGFTLGNLAEWGS